MSDPVVGVIVESANLPGLAGPDIGVVNLRNGLLIEIGDEGLNVYSSEGAYVEGEAPKQRLVFEEGK